MLLPYTPAAVAALQSFLHRVPLQVFDVALNLWDRERVAVNSDFFVLPDQCAFFFFFVVVVPYYNLVAILFLGNSAPFPSAPSSWLSDFARIFIDFLDGAFSLTFPERRRK
jgi:hypothetical protein